LNRKSTVIGDRSSRLHEISGLDIHVAANSVDFVVIDSTNTITKIARKKASLTVYDGGRREPMMRPRKTSKEAHEPQAHAPRSGTHSTTADPAAIVIIPALRPAGLNA
jgi:hypothetical protein